jgi:hypothetical protein
MLNYTTHYWQRDSKQIYEVFASINEEKIPAQLQQAQELIRLTKDKLQYR